MPQQPTPSASAPDLPPLDDEARNRRLTLIGWGLFGVALVVLVARTLLAAKDAPDAVIAPLSFWTFVIAAIAVLGWRGRSRIRRSVAYVVGLALATLASEVASLVSGLGSGSGAQATGLTLTLVALGLTLATMMWAGPGRSPTPLVVVRTQAPPAGRPGAGNRTSRPSGARRPAPKRRPGGGKRPKRR